MSCRTSSPTLNMAACHTALGESWEVMELRAGGRGKTNKQYNWRGRGCVCVRVCVCVWGGDHNHLHKCTAVVLIIHWGKVGLYIPPSCNAFLTLPL